MRPCVLTWAVVVVLPIVSSLVTYTLITLSNSPYTLDETGALVMTIALIKLIILGGTGIFPIDVNKLFDNIVLRGKRAADDNHIHDIHDSLYDNNTLYQIPEVRLKPCTRRFLCEIEAAAKTSENYLPRGPQADEDRIPEEEVAPEEVDPLTELQIEAVRALYREDDPTGELSHRSRRAVQAVEGLTGAACEEAYRMCPGRFDVPGLYRTLFDEFNIFIHPHF